MLKTLLKTNQALVVYTELKSIRLTCTENIVNLSCGQRLRDGLLLEDAI